MRLATGFWTALAKSPAEAFVSGFSPSCFACPGTSWPGSFCQFGSASCAGAAATNKQLRMARTRNRTNVCMEPLDEKRFRHATLSYCNSKPRRSFWHCWNGLNPVGFAAFGRGWAKPNIYRAVGVDDNALCLAADAGELFIGLQHRAGLIVIDNERPEILRWDVRR